MKPGSGGCPALVPETLPVWVGYKAILDPQKELDGIGLVKATALHLKLLKDEEPVWRQYVADLVSKVSGILDDPDSTPDGAMPDSVEDEILAFCQRLRSPLARLRAGLGPAVEIPMRPKLPKGMAWQDVGMNIEDKQKLHIWRRGEPRPTSIITLLFAELTFRDRRRPDDLQATEAWERFRSILDRVERQPDGTGILRPCQNRQDRNLDKQYIKTINDKLKALLDLDGVPLEYSAKVGAYRVLFESRPEPKPAKTPCFPS